MKTLRELPMEERPRERLIAHGSASLTTSELLAILLRTGRKGETALEIGRALALSPGGLAGLSRLTAAQLASVKGIGPAKSVTILAALELGKRCATQKTQPKLTIRSAADVAEHVMPRFRYETREYFLIVLLDTKHHVIDMPVISIGTLDMSVVHPREVFFQAVVQHAAALILVHNHPSGEPTPSREDHVVTDKLAQAGMIFDIPVLDHIVIGDGCYVSFREKGWLTES